MESQALLELVKKGADAIPCLIAHLNDERETEMILSRPGFFGGIFFANEYDYNTKTTWAPVSGINDNETWDRLPTSLETGQKYTLTVGDLCYVALGQIVNRRFSAVRYQPTAIVVINSPAHSSEFLKAVKYEWGTLTSEAHKASLIQDIRKPDYSERQTSAIERLLFYYPDAAKEIDIEQFLE